MFSFSTGFFVRFFFVILEGKARGRHRMSCSPLHPSMPNLRFQLLRFLVFRAVVIRRTHRGMRGRSGLARPSQRRKCGRSRRRCLRCDGRCISSDAPRAVAVETYCSPHFLDDLSRPFAVVAFLALDSARVVNDVGHTNIVTVFV